MVTKDIARLGLADMWYGILATLIIVVGVSRVVFAAKGWGYYSVNYFFWAKMAAFAMVGLMSIAPTLAILRWRRALAKDAAFLPAAGDISGVRRFLWLEVFFFMFILAFAALMARGYGEWT